MNRLRRVFARTERGATAVVVAFSMLFVFAAGALGVDIAKLTYSRQQVRTAIDAAAQAGAYALPNASDALVQATKFAVANSGGLDAPVALTAANVKFYCVIARLASGSPDMSQVPMMCNPGTAGTDYTVASIKCNDSVCAIPCAATKTCNMISVSYNQKVDYNFAPVIGIKTGLTGAQTTASCRGACGQVSPNPMDIVVMADRTPSMADGQTGTPSGSFVNMKAGLKEMLLTMNREQQFVAFGTIAMSASNAKTATCRSNPPVSQEAFTDAAYKTGTQTWSTTDKKYTWNGIWVPVDYSWKYTLGSPADGNLAVNTGDPVYKAMDCLQMSDSETVSYPYNVTGVATQTNTGTHLASALKGAAQYLLDPSKETGFPDRSAYGEPKKVIIFETDGGPSEIFNSHADALSLTNNLAIGAASSVPKGCDNVLEIARQVKARGITIIVIGVGNVNTVKCGDTRQVYDVLASVASPKNGVAATGRNCSLTGAAQTENSDGDNYFCSATANDLKSIFAAAMGSVTGNTKYMKIGGVSD